MRIAASRGLLVAAAAMMRYANWAVLPVTFWRTIPSFPGSQARAPLDTLGKPSPPTPPATLYARHARALFLTIYTLAAYLPAFCIVYSSFVGCRALLRPMWVEWGNDYG
jgi:hypothetical protein